MSILTQIGKYFTNLFGSKNGAFSSLIQIGTIESFPSIDGKNAVDKGFNANTAIYSIVMRDAEKFGSIPRYVFDKSKMQEKAFKGKIERKDLPTNVLDGDLTTLLNRPNEYEGQDIFLTKLRAFYKVAGEGFIWLNRGDVEGMTDEAMEILPVLEMYILPPSMVLLVPDPEDLWGCIDYIFLVNGQKLRLGKPNVIHWKTVNLNFDPYTREHLRGMPPLTPGADTLQQNKDSTKAAVRQYQNDGSKGVLANESMSALSPVQQSQIKDVVDAKINNKEVKGAVAVLQGKWNYMNFMSGVDLNLLEGKQLTWQELCFLFGLPYEFFDAKTTFANKEQAQNGWTSNVMIPACRQLDGELNRILLKAFKLENVAFIGSDFTELLEAQRDLALTVTALASAWWLTPNEKREWMNEEPYDDKTFDEPYIPTGITPLGQMQDGFDMEQMSQQIINQNVGKDTGGGN